MARRDEESSASGAPWWVGAVVLSVLCWMVRVQGLMALPIFGDEAIYLRWAQLIRGGHWWVSLCDPKPPLHFWLLAGVFGMFADPLAGARMVSVLCGVLCVPAVILVCGELGELMRPMRGMMSGRVVGMLAAVLLIFCPFLSFYQRLATADALFVLEMLAAVWLGLRWGRLVVEGRKAWGSAVGLGVVMGIAMLTRQGLSYTLWGMAVAGVVLHLVKEGWGKETRGVVWRWVGQLAVAGVIAGALWSPFLGARLGSFAAEENRGTVGELKRRILYQTDFTQSKESRWEVTRRNFLKTFVPRREVKKDGKLGAPEDGWLFYYLTPGVYAASLLGLVYLGVRRQWYVLVLLGWWLVVMLGPPIVLGNVIYSRYVLAGAVPLLVAAAFLVGDVLAWIVSRRFWAVVLWGVAAVVLGGLLIGPLLGIGVQTKHWDRQTLTRQDRYQYVTGWPAGMATRSAVRALGRMAEVGPIVLLTDDGWGTPADAVWVYLSGKAGVRMYYNSEGSDGAVLLRPAPGGDAFLLRKDKFLYTQPEVVRIAAGVPVYLVVKDPRSDGGSAEEFFRRANPNLGPGITFYGIEGPEGPERVMVFAVR